MRNRIAFMLSLAALAPAAVYAQPRPMIEHIEPTAGPPGTRVRIVAGAFSAPTACSSTSTPSRPPRCSPERITVTVPEGAQTGRWVLSNGTTRSRPRCFASPRRSPRR